MAAARGFSIFGSVGSPSYTVVILPLHTHSLPSLFTLSSSHIPVFSFNAGNISY
jgi:hypothetical protein